MKKSLFVFFALLVSFVSQSSAQAGDNSIGVGVIVGSPNGVTVRSWFDEIHSFDVGAGWNLGNTRKFQMHADYLWNRVGLIDLNGAAFDLFFGGGFAFRTRSGSSNGEVVFGPRVPVGVSHEFSDPNLELFVQTALNVGLIPSSDVYLDFNLGARLYF